MSAVPSAKSGGKTGNILTAKFSEPYFQTEILPEWWKELSTGTKIGQRISDKYWDFSSSLTCFPY